MRSILGIILIIVGVIAITKVSPSPSLLEIISTIIGICIVTFLPAYFLLRKKKNKK